VFPGLCPRRLAAISRQTPTLLTDVSRLSTRMGTAFQIVRDCLLRPSRDGYLATAWQRAYLRSNSLAIAVCYISTDLP
jgi:hypothetical protein